MKETSVLIEALQKIASLADYDETNEWLDPYGLLEDIDGICRELHKKEYI